MMGKFIASLMLAVCISGSAHAETGSSESPFSLRGFGTIGLARSSSDHAEFVRDLSQPVGIKGGQWSGRIDSILGVQANWQATPEIELVGQVVSRLHYDRSHNPELMWAFAKWEPDPRLSLRAGRIGADFMMLADSRLVGYSYLPVRPPTDFFGPLFFSHFDGADLSLTMPMGRGLLRGKLFAGKTQEKAAGEPGIWDTSGSAVRGVVLDYITGPWQFRANAASIRFAGDIYTYGMPDMLRSAGVSLNIPTAIAAADSLLSKGTVTRYYSLGVVYDNGPLQVQGMLNKICHETEIFENSHAGYFLAGYRVAAVTPFVGISWWKSKTRTYATGLPEPGFTVLNQGYLGFIAGARVDQTTYTLGTRWDLRNNIALKLQWDAVRGNSASRFSFQRSDSDWNGKTNVLTATLDFVF
jgi:hypothetical protein